MKKNLFSLLSILFVAVLCVGFASCSGGDDGNQRSDIVKNLMNHKWTGSSTDYDVHSYGGSTFTQSWTVYFTSDHEGIIINNIVDRDSKYGTNKREEVTEFTYSIDGNKIRLSGNSNFVFEYHDTYMMEGQDKFSARELTSTDHAYLQEYKDSKGYAATVNNGVLATTKQIDKYQLQLDITSNLAQKYPNKTIKYIVKIETTIPKKYNLDNVSKEASFTDNNNLHVDNLYDLNPYAYHYLKSYIALKEKINSGVELTGSEQTLFSNLIKNMDLIVDYSHYQYFVEINGNRYEIPSKNL